MSESFTERTEIPQPVPGYALADLLGVDQPDLGSGAGLPPLWHWVYLLDRPALADLGPDGHPVRGTVPAPPGPGRRRMWAGGRVRTHGSLRCGRPATKRTRVLAVTEKQGRTGHLTFVTVGVQVRQDGAVVVDEEQDIVYRDAAPGPPTSTGAGLPRASAGARGPGRPGRAGNRHLPRPAVPLLRADLQRAPCPLRPRLLPRRGGLPRPAHPRPAAGPRHGRGRPRGRQGDPAAGPGDVSFTYRLVAPLFDDQGLIVGAAPGPDGTTITAARDRYGRQTATGTFS